MVVRLSWKGCLLGGVARRSNTWQDAITGSPNWQLIAEADEQ